MSCFKLPPNKQSVSVILFISLFIIASVTDAFSAETLRASDMQDKQDRILLAKVESRVPNDFTIAIHSGPRMPGSDAPSLFLSIEATGKCKYYETNVNGKEEFTLVKEFTLSPDAIEKIYEAIVKERFYELKPEYRDPEIRDGDFAQVEVRAKGKTYRVLTVNIKVGAFDRIVNKINDFLPKGVIIYYNALTTDAYKKVER